MTISVVEWYFLRQKSSQWIRNVECAFISLNKHHYMLNIVCAILITDASMSLEWKHKEPIYFLSNRISKLNILSCAATLSIRRRNLGCSLIGINLHGLALRQERGRHRCGIYSSLKDLSLYPMIKMWSLNNIKQQRILLHIESITITMAWIKFAWESVKIRSEQYESSKYREIKTERSKTLRGKY